MAAEKLLKGEIDGFFAVAGSPAVDISHALMIVAESASADLVHGVTRALWNDKAHKLLDEGHEKGKLVRVATVLEGVGIPLHPGAPRYNREIGKLE